MPELKYYVQRFYTNTNNLVIQHMRSHLESYLILFMIVVVPSLCRWCVYRNTKWLGDINPKFASMIKTHIRTCLNGWPRWECAWWAAQFAQAHESKPLSPHFCASAPPALPLSGPGQTKCATTLLHRFAHPLPKSHACSPAKPTKIQVNLTSTSSKITTGSTVKRIQVISTTIHCKIRMLVK